MTPFMGQEQVVEPGDGRVGYALPTRAEMEEFCRKADAFLARRQRTRGRFNFASQKVVPDPT